MMSQSNSLSSTAPTPISTGYNLTALVGGPVAAETYNLRGSVTALAPVAAGRVGYVVSGSDQYNIGDVLRLDSIDDFDLIFARFNTGPECRRMDSKIPVAVQSSLETGPGENSSGPYVFTESSGATGKAQLDENSVATVLSTLMAAWVDSMRIMAFRASIAGTGTFDTEGGFLVEGRVSSSDSWSTIELIEGWSYNANGYTAGGTLTDSNGDAQDIAQDGGWVDYEVTIPDEHTQVRIRMDAATSSDSHRHDLRAVEYGVAPGWGSCSHDLQTARCGYGAGAGGCG